MTIKTVVIGGRGHTGSELLPLLHRHPEVELVGIGSSSAAGELVKNEIPNLEDCLLRFQDITPETLHQFPADLYILALPNGQASSYVAVIDKYQTNSVVIDLSADYRFDDAWIYGQPELFAERIAGARRIANPGCYATGAQLALAPVLEYLRAPPVVFGVSGYSGAGKTPSRRNDPAVLKDNLLAYSLTGHIHEREASRHLNCEIRFLPHVAAFFRGISLTISVDLNATLTSNQLQSLFQEFYGSCPLISVCEAIPEVAEISGRHGVVIGGFAVDKNMPQFAAWVCVLDNLLKGAATQVVQNLNLAFGLPLLAGLKDGLSRRGGVCDE